MTFAFSQKSIDKLQGVHPDLLKIVNLAITKSAVDFGITEGVRSAKQQAIFYHNGASERLVSRHMTGHAVDVLAYLGARGTYKPESLYFEIANAFLAAAKELKIPLEWGGAFGRDLTKFNSAEDAKKNYDLSRLGRKKFFDGVHFNLLDSTHPADPKVVANLEDDVRNELDLLG